MVNECDLCGRTRYLRRGSGPSYLWQEVTKHTTAGTLLKRQLRIVRRWNRYGMHSKRASSNQLHFGISETLYLADFRQEELETTADLDLRIKQTVRGCQWKKETHEERMIDLLYHATIYYEIRKFVQESEPAALTYEMVIEKAKPHEHNILEYEDHQASHGGANSAPSYNNPLLSAHALSKRRPSGRGNNGQRCGKCGKSHE